LPSSARNCRACRMRGGAAAAAGSESASYASHAYGRAAQDGARGHRQALPQAPYRQVGRVVAQCDVELAAVGRRVADYDVELVRVDEEIALGVALDELARQRLPLLGAQAGDRGARGVGRKLLHRMRGAEIDAVGDHPEQEEEIEREKDGELDRGGPRCRGREVAAMVKGALPAHALRLGMGRWENRELYLQPEIAWSGNGPAMTAKRHCFVDFRVHSA